MKTTACWVSSLFAHWLHRKVSRRGMGGGRGGASGKGRSLMVRKGNQPQEAVEGAEFSLKQRWDETHPPALLLPPLGPEEREGCRGGGWSKESGVGQGQSQKERGAEQGGEGAGPHRGQVAVLRGRAQVQQPPLLRAHAQEHAVEDVEVPLLRGLRGRRSPEVAVPPKVVPPAWRLLRGFSARWAPFTEAQLACRLPSSWAQAEALLQPCPKTAQPTSNPPSGTSPKP